MEGKAVDYYGVHVFFFYLGLSIVLSQVCS